MAYIGRQPTVGNFRICDAISVVNGQAAYTMQVGGVNVVPESANNMIVSLNGVIQKPGSSFTVSSSTITFSSSLSTGDVIDFIQILGGVANIGTPSDGTVSLAKLSATGTKSSSTFLRGDNTFAAAGLSGWSENGSNNDLLPGNASAGIYLGVNSATASNLLNDYEEGTWTVDFVRSGSSIGSFNNRSAHYTKIGNVVYVSASTQYTGSSLSGSYIVGQGLPFTISSKNKTGVSGTYLLGPGSGSTNQSVGSAGGWNEQNDFFMVPGGQGQDRYISAWTQNNYLVVAFWYYTDA
ncbi:hypothetical protein OAA03_00240 [bacterium]|nr:hypothetical protein [bacterium]